MGIRFRRDALAGPSLRSSATAAQSWLHDRCPVNARLGMQSRKDSEPSWSGAVLIQQGFHFVAKGGEVCFEDAPYNVVRQGIVAVN